MKIHLCYQKILYGQILKGSSQIKMTVYTEIHRFNNLRQKFKSFLSLITSLYSHDCQNRQISLKLTAAKHSPWNSSSIEQVSILTHVQWKSHVPVCTVPRNGLRQHAINKTKRHFNLITAQLFSRLLVGRFWHYYNIFS